MKNMKYIEQNAKLKIFRNLVFSDRYNLRIVNKNFNGIFKKYKHEKSIYTNYKKNINYGEYKNIIFALNNFDKPLINVPNNVHIFNIKKKTIYDPNIKELPSELGNVHTLYLHNLPNIKELPSELCNVHTLTLHNFPNIKELPSELGNVHTLHLYNLQNLKELPSELGNVHKLSLFNLQNLKELPSELGNVHTLKLKNLSNLKEVPSELGNVHDLELHDLPNLKELPSELGNVHTLELHNLPNIKELPSELGNVHTLYLWYLSNIKELPSNFKNIKNIINHNNIPFKNSHYIIIIKMNYKKSVSLSVVAKQNDTKKNTKYNINIT